MARRHGLPASYDSWRTSPPEGPDETLCPECGEEGYPGEHCRTPDCDEYLPSEADLREEAEERKAEARAEAAWDDDPGRDEW